jgi:hypothetical protein
MGGSVSQRIIDAFTTWIPVSQFKILREGGIIGNEKVD